MPDQPDKIDQTIDSDNVFCSHCGIENARGGYSCARCGERILLVTTDTPSPMGLVSCARCGGANFNRAVHCWVCGTEMNDEVRISPATPVEPARKARTYEHELNPISVPAPARELRDPAVDSISGSGPGTSVGPVPVANDAAMSEEPETNTSGMKRGEVPRDIKRWNWAAFLMAPIWGIFSGVPIAALMFAVYLPVFPSTLRIMTLMGASLFLGFRGNELAWRGKKWRSVKHFKSVQQRWVVWSIGLNLAGLVLLILLTGSAAEG